MRFFFLTGFGLLPYAFAETPPPVSIYGTIVDQIRDGESDHPRLLYQALNRLFLLQARAQLTGGSHWASLATTVLDLIQTSMRSSSEPLLQTEGPIFEHWHRTVWTYLLEMKSRYLTDPTPEAVAAFSTPFARKLDEFCSLALTNRLPGEITEEEPLDATQETETVTF